MKIPFKYYLHDGEKYDTAYNIQNQIKDKVDLDVEQIIELVGSPFYEVTLDCELDTETGEVTLLKASLD